MKKITFISIQWLSILALWCCAPMAGHAAAPSDAIDTENSYVNSIPLTGSGTYCSLDAHTLALQGMLDWVVGEYTGGNSMLLIRFEASQADFNQFVVNYGLFSMTIHISYSPGGPENATLIKSIEVDDLVNGFDISAWSDIIPDPETTGEYYVELFFPDYDCGGTTLLAANQAEIVEEPEETPEIEITQYDCGDEFQEPTITGASAPLAVNGGFSIYGLPAVMKVQSGGSASTGYTGTGIVALPFGKKVLKIGFTGLKINSTGFMTAGTITPASNTSFDPSIFQMDNYSIGGEICLPPPPPPEYDQEGFHEVTGLDGYGFDRDGNHSGTGTTVDENGYDQSGNHEETGTPYNPGGCNRDGVDEKGDACNPGGDVNPESKDYAEEEALNIKAILETLLNQEKNVQNAQVENQRGQCNIIKNDFTSMVEAASLEDNAFVYGENNEFIDEGLSTHFASEPKPLGINLDRDQAIVDIEKKHIELYACDVVLEKDKAILAIITELLTTAGLQAFTDEVLVDVSKWTPAQLTTFQGDATALNEWLQQKVDIKIQREKESAGYGVILPQDIINPADVFDNINQEYIEGRWSSSVVSSAPDFFVDDSFEERLREIEFKLSQGDKVIDGIPRGLYIEELYRQNQLLNGPEADQLMPLKVSKTVGAQTINIYLDNISLSSNGASVDAYLIIEDPNDGQKLVFSATGVGFNAAGIDGPGKLSLESNVDIRISNALKLTVRGGDNGTAAYFDCEGFSHLDLDLDFEFCRNYLIPLNPSTYEPIPDPGRVDINVRLTGIEAWNEFVLETNMPPFAVAGYEDVKWEVQRLIIDMSDTETPEFKPVEGYKSVHYNGATLDPKWRGFYLEELNVVLPTTFAEGNPEPPRALGVKDVLIDGNGISGEVYATDVLVLDEGNIGGWPFSINEMRLTVVNNSFSGAGFKGEVNIPVFDGNSGYEATMYPGNQYRFAISPLGSQQMDMLLATVALEADSKLEIALIEGDFIAKATLNGKAFIGSSGGDGPVTIDLPDVCFQGFEISNKSPYFSPGEWGISESASATVYGFGIKVNSLKPYSETSASGQNETGMRIDFDVSVSQAVKLKAEGNLGIIGVLGEDAQGRQEWTHDRVELYRLKVDGSFPGVEKIEGELEFFEEDAVYGRGFRGGLHARFAKIGVEVTAVAQFGKMPDFDYFFVDAVADLNLGISAGPLQLKGFGGGVSYHMTSGTASGNNIFNDTGEFTLPDIGVSLSGVNYTPDIGTGLGLKATVVMSTAKEELFNGKVSLEMEFDAETNGIQKIAFRGSGQMIKGLNISMPFTTEKIGMDTIPPPNDAAISAYISLEYDFEATTFTGGLDVFLNSPIIKGRGKNNHLIKAELFFSPEDWFIYIGTPENRCGAIMDIAGIGQVDVSAYFDIGTDIPFFPELPDEVKSIARKVRSNEGLRQSGSGIMFGGSLDVHLSGSFGKVVSGELSAGVGFDIMLRHYENAYCAGGNPADGIGIGGWYAAGQAWAYAEGKVKAFGVKILEAGLAVAMQARLPNPTFVQATVGLKVKLLFVSKTFNMSLAIGEDCTIVTQDGDLSGIEVIAYLDPLDESEGAETFLQPAAYFNIPLNKKIEIPDINTGELIEYEARLVTQELVSDQGITIPGTVTYENDKTQMTFVPRFMMPGDAEMTWSVTVAIYRNGIKVDEEVKTTTFTTLPSLDFIPEVNVQGAYPATGMSNFYKEENNAQEGYIKLVSGQPELFQNVPDGYEQKVRLSDKEGNVHLLDFTAAEYGSLLTFGMSPSLLENERMYHLELIQQRTNQAEAGTQGAQPDNVSGDPDEDQNRIFYEVFFRTSKYNTFREKIVAINANSTQGGLAYSASIPGALTKYVEADEGFDEWEIYGGENFSPLLTMTFDESHNWFQNYNDIMYDAYPSFFYAYEITYLDEATYPLRDLPVTLIRSLEDTRATIVTKEKYNDTWQPYDELGIAQTIDLRIERYVREHFNNLKKSIDFALTEVYEANQDSGQTLAEILGPEGAAMEDLLEVDFAPATTDLKVRLQYKLPFGPTTSDFSISFNK